MYNHTITLYNGWIPLSDLVSLGDYTKIERIPIPKEPCNQKLDVDDLTLPFTHKLDTCCQAMCQERRIAKNPAFRQRRTFNRLDSVTVCTVGVNSNDLTAIERYEKECFVQMLKLFAKENNLQKVELETDIRESTLKQFMTKNCEFREKWKCDIQQCFSIREIPETNTEQDAVVSIMLTGNIQDMSFLYDFPCESGITLHSGEKCIMYLCFERPSEISFVCTEKNVGDNYLEVLKVYQKKIIERIDKRQTNEIIYAIETMEVTVHGSKQLPMEI